MGDVVYVIVLLTIYCMYVGANYSGRPSSFNFVGWLGDKRWPILALTMPHDTRDYSIIGHMNHT